MSIETNRRRTQKLTLKIKSNLLFLFSFKACSKNRISKSQVIKAHPLFKAQRAKREKAARRKSLDIIEIREEFRPDVDITPLPKGSTSLMSLDVDKLKPGIGTLCSCFYSCLGLLVV